MGAWPRDGLVCFFSGTLGKTHPGKCISEAFWNALRTCWSGRILAYRAQRVRAPSGAVWSSEGLNGDIGGWVESGPSFALPHPIPSTSVFVCFIYWCVCTCVHTRVRGKTGLASMVEIWIQIKPFVHILALRLPGVGLGEGGRGSLSLLSSICAVRLRKKKHYHSQNRTGAQ